MAPDPFLERALSRRRVPRSRARGGRWARLAARRASLAERGVRRRRTRRPTSRSCSRSDLVRVAQPQRLVFALSHSGAKGIQFASGPAVSVRFRGPGGRVVAARRRRPTTAPGSRRAAASTWRDRRFDSAGRVAGRGPGPGPEGAVHDPGERRARSTGRPGHGRRRGPRHRPRPTRSASTRSAPATRRARCTRSRCRR